MFLLELKKTEAAMKGGRLDEAFQILQSSAEREHRDGQRLTDRLVAAFVERATQHLADERLDDARADADRARMLGGRQREVTELLQRISAADALRQQRQMHRKEVIASAKHQIQTGAWSAGAKLLQQLDDDSSVFGRADAQRLTRSVKVNREIVERAVTRIEQAVRQQDYESAVRVILGLQPDQQARPEIVALLHETVAPLVEQGLTDLRTGRLDRACATESLLRPLRDTHSGVRELQQVLQRCRSIHASLKAHEYAEAEAQLGVLAQILPDSAWVEEACSGLADVVQQLKGITAGPLGILDDASEASLSTVAVTLRRAAPIVSPGPERALPSRSILQVDGVGRLLLLTNDVITVGAASSPSSRVDVPLLTEGAGAAISIRRNGEDYFAESSAAFAVNGQSVTRRLLAAGDTIAVGARGRVRFQKPVAASSSAILQITGSRTESRDIRRVVLMADSLLFGPAGSHFRVGDLAHSLVLYRDRNGLALREAAAWGAGVRTQQALAIGESVVMEDVRFVLTEAG